MKSTSNRSDVAEGPRDALVSVEIFQLLYPTDNNNNNHNGSLSKKTFIHPHLVFLINIQFPSFPMFHSIFLAQLSGGTILLQLYYKIFSQSFPSFLKTCPYHLHLHLFVKYYTTITGLLQENLVSRHQKS